MTDRTQSQQFGFFYIFCYVTIPCICIIICYTKIFIHVSKYSGKINGKGQRKNIQLAKSLCASFITYFICWIPFGLIYLIDHNDILHPAAFVITTALAHTNSAVNPVYFAYFSLSFRRGYLKLLHRILPFCFKMPIKPTKTNQSYQSYYT